MNNGGKTGLVLIFNVTTDIHCFINQMEKKKKKKNFLSLAYQVIYNGIFVCCNDWNKDIYQLPSKECLNE
jgi:hypothetical protein